MSNIEFVNKSIDFYFAKFTGRHTAKLKQNFENFAEFVRNAIDNNDLGDSKQNSFVIYQMRELQKIIKDKENQNEYYRTHLDKIKRKTKAGE